MSVATQVSPVGAEAHGGHPGLPHSHSATNLSAHAHAHAHSSVVPAYPYNVAIVPNRDSTAPTPDDSGINTRLPSICVDYLSHDWVEDDVWASWKAMTRHKSEIANGVRLENASWRTWAKQRGKLKTISPETLNWLKDSDVTWLYGPLHTAVDAVPPPKVATASDRLGLEPLRSMSDSKAASKDDSMAAPGNKPGASMTTTRKGKRVAVVTKPILKYRSLSDILLPASTPSSPVLEVAGMDFGTVAADRVPHARSESNLTRMGSASRRGRLSPIHSPRGTSPDPHASDSSTATTTTRSERRRHISFNHRVEQCIAVDSSDEVKRYPKSGPRVGGGRATLSTSDDDDDPDDDEDDVLTFRSSHRVVGPVASIASTRTSDSEPHTIARLGPTTLKSTEIYPAPSPVVVFTGPIENAQPVTSSAVDQSTLLGPYSSRPAAQNVSGRRRPMYDYNAAAASATGYVAQWGPEEEDDYAMGFDYFNSGGPDVSVGDEYDMVQYGHQHLVGNPNNNYQGGTAPNPSPYSSYSPYGTASPVVSSSPPSSSDSSPNHSRKSSGAGGSPSSSPASPPQVVRGPHAPVSSKEAPSPKRSAFKGGRMRDTPATINDMPGGGPPSPRITPPGSGRASPVYSSSPQLGVRPSYRRKGSSDEVFRSDREPRGRSTSRESSSSLERSNSTDRTRSISPSYASIVAGVSAQPIGIPGSRRGGGGSSDSLNGVASQFASSRTMPDLPEASSESEDDGRATVKETKKSVELPSTNPTSTSNGGLKPQDESVVNSDETSVAEAKAIPRAASKAKPSPVIVEPPSATPEGPKSPPLIPAPTHAVNASGPNHPSTSGGGPRLRQPSPSSATTSTSTGDTTSGVPDTASISSSPALDPIDLASTQWSDEVPAPSYARRSLLRAARGGSQSGPNSTSADRDESAGRASIESGRGSTHEDYGFGYYDDDGEAGLVGRTLEVAGTARDLLGAITKGIWGLGRR